MSAASFASVTHDAAAITIPIAIAAAAASKTALMIWLFQVWRQPAAAVRYR